MVRLSIYLIYIFHKISDKIIRRTGTSQNTFITQTSDINLVSNHLHAFLNNSDLIYKYRNVLMIRVFIEFYLIGLILVHRISDKIIRHPGTSQNWYAITYTPASKISIEFINTETCSGSVF